MRTWEALVVAVVACLVLSAAAAAPDPSTFPAGVRSVTNSSITPGQEFQVTVEIDDGVADQATVTVCRFKTATAPTPQVCFQNLRAAYAGVAFRADTAASDHPAWKDGWVLGYKVTLHGADGDLHAPNLKSGDEWDYYRFV